MAILRVMRLFMALQIPREIKRQISDRLRPLFGIKNMRWTPEESLHMTLHFLGEEDRSKVADIERFMDDIAKENRPFSLSLNGGGVFPAQGKPRVFWVGVTGEVTYLENLASQLSAGFPKEDRKFKPHLTVARTLKNQKVDFVTLRQQFCTLMRSYKTKSFQINEMHLMKSQLSSKGSQYTSITRFSLRSDA